MNADDKISGQIPAECSGMRLDKALAMLYPAHSRSTIQKWLKDALVSVDDEILPQKQIVSGGELFEIQLPQQPDLHNQAQKLDIDIVHQDEDILVVNKPQGLVVHPGAGNPDETLLNGLLYHDRKLYSLPRAGIVHRLDKDTSGLMVVARTESARLKLIEQLQTRQMSRTYLAVVNGVPISGGTVEASISRHPVDRRRMTVSSSGKQAISHFRVEQKFRNHSLLSVKLESGRTHQIRVHMKHIGYPIFGDPVYGQRLSIPKHASDELISMLKGFKRQSLHAKRLSFIHPGLGRCVEFEQPVPDDMRDLIHLLKLDLENNA